VEVSPNAVEEASSEEQGSLVAPLDATTTTAVRVDDLGNEASAGPLPLSGGTMRVAVEAEADGLNPAANNFAVAAYVMAYPIFDPLVYFDREGNWIPYLAESFTSNDDGTVWRMKLREGVRFHDGTDLTADDVVATVSAQLADPVISLVYRNTIDIDDFITKIDDLTVEMRVAKPSARFPLALTGQLGMVLPSEWLELAREDPTLNQKPVGQGPFMLSSRVQDVATVLVRNPDYWAADRIPVYLDRIEIYPITDMVIAAERLTAGDLDLAITTNAEATLIMREAAGVETIENLLSDEGFAVINAGRPPFDDIRARQALTFAADRDGYLELIRQGTSPPADTMFHPDLIWHNPEVKQETNMPERAAPLVEAYCADHPENCSGGRINMELHFGGPSVENVRIADLQTDAWEEFFNITPVEVLQDKLINQVVLGDYDVVNWRQFGTIDPDGAALWLECDSIGFISLNFPRHCEAERDELMLESRATGDLDRRVEIWHRIQEMIRDSYTYIFYYHTNWAVGAHDGVHRICGQMSPDGTELWCNNSGRVLLSGIWLG
jgi:peptide/nickel transport system substrate-binding protein